ncbi:glycosyltransferase family 4 protein [Priestia aryabhattai]
MKEVTIIGPIPPPIHGESLALDNLIKSEEINNSFSINVLNTNRKNVSNAGKFSFRKILQDINIIYKSYKQKSDIIYISISQTKLGLLRDLIIIKLVRRKSSKIITHLHGNNLGNTIDKLTPLEKKITKHTFGLIDTAIVLGEKLVPNYRNMASHVDVVSNGISKDYISIAELSDANLKRAKSKTLKLLYLSNLIESKGFLLATKAVIDLVKEGYKVELVLAGAIHDYDKYEEFKELLQKENCKEKIKYIGVVTGKYKKDLLLSSDIMVLPTNYKIEGQPISIIEGMAAGLPIVSTNVGCIDDMIQNNGILLEYPTVSDLKVSIKKLIEEEKLRMEYSDNSRQHFEKNYSLDNYIARIKDIFNDVSR